MKFIAIWGLTAIAASILAGALAGVKNRDVSYWMGWCFVIPPLLIALFMISSLKEPRHPRRSSDDPDST